MARPDVYANPDAAGRRHTPYFVDVHNGYIDHIETWVEIPLRREAAFGPRARNLHPLLQVAGEPVVLDTLAIGATHGRTAQARGRIARRPRRDRGSAGHLVRNLLK